MLVYWTTVSLTKKAHQRNWLYMFCITAENGWTKIQNNLDSDWQCKQHNKIKIKKLLYKSRITCTYYVILI